MANLGRALAEVARIAREETPGDDPAHDGLHVARVRASALRIAAAEGADAEVVEVAALLHELFNFPKGHPEAARSGEVCAEHARRAMDRAGVPRALHDPVAYAIAVHPYSLGVEPVTLEACVLQDADRLDALGAIGVARCFTTGARMGAAFYAADDPFCVERAPDDKAYSIDHFYRKLLRVPESMRTAAGRAAAERRTEFLRVYLHELRRELSETC